MGRTAITHLQAVGGSNMRTWIVLDVSCLAYRAGHTKNEMQHGDQKTGVIYGVLQDIKKLESHFGSEHFVFAFDSFKNHRRRKHPWYKLRTQSNQPAYQEIRSAVIQQGHLLREDILPALGYMNLFMHDGYEADDVIARVVESISGGERIVIVSSDDDLYQLLSNSVDQYRPHGGGTLMTRKTFQRSYRITPRTWAKVKAITGCKSDTIPGLNGVGSVFACNFLSGHMKPDHRMYEPIRQWITEEQFRTNLELITLPYAGCHPFRPVVHKATTEQAWAKQLDRFGIRSLGDVGIAHLVRKGMVRSK